MQELIKPLFASHLLVSCWSKPSPETVWEVWLTGGHHIPQEGGTESDYGAANRYVGHSGLDLSSVFQTASVEISLVVDSQC